MVGLIARVKSVVIWSVIGLLALTVLIGVGIGLSIPFALIQSFDTSIEPLAGDRTVIGPVSVLDPGTGSVLPDRWVVIERGHITTVATDEPVSLLGENRIEGDGLTLLPGLIDMHVHVLDRTDLLLYLSHGVTTVRNMMGLSMHQRFRNELERGSLPGPRMLSASPTLNHNMNAPFHRYVDDPEEARQLVRRYAEEKYDLIKVYNGLQPEVFYAIKDEADRVGLPLAGHPINALSFQEVLDAGYTSIEHVEEIYRGPMRRKERGGEELSLDEVVRMVKDSNVPIVPTLAAFRNLALAAEGKEAFVDGIDRDLLNPIANFFGDRALADPLSRDDPGSYLRAMAAMEAITVALYEADVMIPLGTDTGPSLTIPGDATIDEIEHLVSIGLAPMDVLRSATHDAALVLGLDNEIGSVAPGFRADLVLVAGDPLDDPSLLRRPVAVLRDGQVYTRDRLDHLQDRARKNMGIYETVGWYLHHELTK